MLPGGQRRLCAVPAIYQSRGAWWARAALSPYTASQLFVTMRLCRGTAQLIGSTQLSSGRFAMIDDGVGLSLVPWWPALEQHIGRHIFGTVMPGGRVD